MNKKNMSERDICTKYINPAITKSGWAQDMFLEEVSFTDGRILVRGQKTRRGKQKRADYILFAKPNLPIALIEAKRNDKSLGGGMQQVLDYAEMLDIPFVFSSNGDGFIEHDRTITDGDREIFLTLDQFPSPATLWQRYLLWKQFDQHSERVISEPYYADPSGKSPRYYQRVAINRTIEAVSRGQDRILLVMATGTGKTYTAFQIIWRLWKSRQKKRILFLADRNILVDQTMSNDFKPFTDKMCKIANRRVDKSYEIYLALYQGITGVEEIKNIYKEFSPNFFDLIVVDECHRGSAKENSAWREILEYFHSATQIGLTATPKETKEVSSSTYFGEPIYTYSLKQGIEDGFLAPYKVVRINTDRDTDGWRPEKGKVDKFGREIEDRVYNRKDFDRNVVLENRTKLVAHKITQYLKETSRFQKTIVFCVDIDHAERMRSALVNANSDLVAKHSKYVARITGESQEELYNFMDPASPFPVIATTSRLLTTGVDTQTVGVIALDTNISSVGDFKQIVGRGTRVKEEQGKLFFTIMDFRGVTRLFADPAFDGEPEIIYEPGDGDDLVPPDGGNDDFGDDFSGEDEPKPPTVKLYVDDVSVKEATRMIQYLDANGNLITESITDYTKKTVQHLHRDLESWLKHWNEEDKKEVIVQELLEQGVYLDELEQMVGKDYDVFDLICHVAFDQRPLTRQERANNVKKRDYFGKYGEQARKVINALLDRYATVGIEEIENMQVLRTDPFSKMGSPIELVKVFGGKSQYKQAMKKLKQHIYAS